MIFALLFIAAFLVGLLIYLASRKWWLAVSLPMMAFILFTLMDSAALGLQAFTLTFGLPIIFFASLLGAYVVQMRTVEQEEAPTSDTDEEPE